MQLSVMAYMSNATKLYYLNLLGRLMLRPLLVTLGRDTGVAFKPTSPPPTADAPPPGCLIACFLGGLFDIGLEACFVFSGGCGASLASSLSLLFGVIFWARSSTSFILLSLSAFLFSAATCCRASLFSLAACLAAFELAFLASSSSFSLSFCAKA
jgi:hypothetical protein